MNRFALARSIAAIGLLFATLSLTGCETTDRQLRDQGQSEAFITGFHDGRHSGIKEAGNAFEHFIRDHDRFENDTDYRSGWLAGEAEGKRLQQQASAIGTAAAGAYTSSAIDREVDKNQDFDKIARDTVKGTDTSGLGALGSD